jgi:hypothetical protein
MRASLKPLEGRRSRFRARFAGVSRAGHLILENIRSPAGREAYVWIPFERWPGKMMLPASEFNFSARVKAYCRDRDNSFDFSLTDIEIEEV